MIPRLINMKQVQKHCFCLTSLTLTLMSVLLKFYTWNVEGQLKSDAVVSAYIRGYDEVKKTFKFEEMSVDSTGTYLIYRNINFGTRKFSKNGVTLLTHCSVQGLSHLPMLTKCWDGPISVAVFVDVLDDFKLFLKTFVACHSNILPHVRFHVVTPVDQSSLDYISLMGDFNLSSFFEDPLSTCYDSEITLKELRSKRANYDSNVPYPNNLLRNVARLGSETEFIFSVDIDMLPSKRMHKLFNLFSKKILHEDPSQCDDVAYIVPVFEIDSSYFYANSNQFPIAKNRLATLIDNKVVRPFYSDVCDHCHNRTDYAKWCRLKVSGIEAFEVAYTVSWGHAYEPFYISRKEFTPLFDERFKQYGYNRVSNLCELHVAGWKFDVLNAPFLLHIGFKEKQSDFHASKRKEMATNFKHYQEFRKSLVQKYPNSDRNCDIPPIFKL